jgi:hypothetical protein
MCANRREHGGDDGALWYVGAALRRAPAILCAPAAAVAASVVLAGCGGAERRDAGVPDATYTVAVQRATFPAHQHLAQRTALVLAVRNTGDRAIPELVVTVRGFTDRSGGAGNADPDRDLWIVDQAPAEAGTAFQDTWSAGRLEPGRSATLRWELTPVVAGRHAVRYEIGPGFAGRARAQLAGGGVPRGDLRVRVTDRPAQARVDPRTGAVVRDE